MAETRPRTTELQIRAFRRKGKKNLLTFTYVYRLDRFQAWGQRVKRNLPESKASLVRPGEGEGATSIGHVTLRHWCSF